MTTIHPFSTYGTSDQDKKRSEEIVEYLEDEPKEIQLSVKGKKKLRLLQSL